VQLDCTEKKTRGVCDAVVSRREIQVRMTVRAASEYRLSRGREGGPLIFQRKEGRINSQKSRECVKRGRGNIPIKMEPGISGSFGSSTTTIRRRKENSVGHSAGNASSLTEETKGRRGVEVYSARGKKRESEWSRSGKRH